MMKSKTGKIQPYNFGHKVKLIHTIIDVIVERWISSDRYSTRDTVARLRIHLTELGRHISTSIFPS